MTGEEQILTELTSSWLAILTVDTSAVILSPVSDMTSFTLPQFRLPFQVVSYHQLIHLVREKNGLVAEYLLRRKFVLL